MNYLDHVLALVVFVVHPIVGYVSVKPIYARLQTGETIDRIKMYRQTIIQQWCLFFLTVFIWFYQGRDWFVLQGDDSISMGPWIASIVVAVALALLFFQVREIRTKTSIELGDIENQLGVLGKLLPHNRSELKTFDLLSGTAGIVEEVLWRGFLIWYLSHFVPVIAAIVIGSIGFGLAHAYQGFANVPKIVVVGLLLGAIYWLSGSLWLSILLHGVADMLQGRVAYEVNRQREAG